MVEKLYVIAVAPHTGAWIETAGKAVKAFVIGINPHTGMPVLMKRAEAQVTAVLPESVERRHFPHGKPLLYLFIVFFT